MCVCNTHSQKNGEMDGWGPVIRQRLSTALLRPNPSPFLFFRGLLTIATSQGLKSMHYPPIRFAHSLQGPWGSRLKGRSFVHQCLSLIIEQFSATSQLWHGSKIATDIFKYSWRTLLVNLLLIVYIPSNVSAILCQIFFTRSSIEFCSMTAISLQLDSVGVIFNDWSNTWNLYSIFHTRMTITHYHIKSSCVELHLQRKLKRTT